MNGAFEKLKRATQAAHPNSIRDLLGGFALPAMAAVGTLAVVGVLAGLQCGGIDRCFVGKQSVATTAEAPAAFVAEPLVEERLVADQAVAVTPPAVPEPDARTRQIAVLIGNSFEAIRADDAGWLSGAYSPTGEPVELVEEGDGAGPVVTAAAETTPVPVVSPNPVSGAEAVAAIAALEQPVKPLERPKPLAVTAFAEEPPDTEPAVKAAARQQLAAVAAEAVPVETEPEPEEEPAEAPAKVAAVQAGDVRTVTGSGANVRSGPGKSNKTLFALAGGEKVTAGEDQRGWIKITDDQNRTGWIYKTYLN